MCAHKIVFAYESHSLYHQISIPLQFSNYPDTSIWHQTIDILGYEYLNIPSRNRNIMFLDQYSSYHQSLEFATTCKLQTVHSKTRFTRLLSILKSKPFSILSIYDGSDIWSATISTSIWRTSLNNRCVTDPFLISSQRVRADCPIIT